ncbi:MAG: hypothetical protein IAG10_21850 [Planctomycetaceae bacterium]|nr:hypothetical protein [Planctomycetaceae bacterium]
MSTLTGTLVDGTIQLDQPVDLPNHSRVIVQVQVHPQDDWRERTRRRLADWRKFCDEHPTGSGGEKFNREALYEDA